MLSGVTLVVHTRLQTNFAYSLPSPSLPPSLLFLLSPFLPSLPPLFLSLLLSPSLPPSSPFLPPYSLPPSPPYSLPPLPTLSLPSLLSPSLPLLPLLSGYASSSAAQWLSHGLHGTRPLCGPAYNVIDRVILPDAPSTGTDIHALDSIRVKDMCTV